MDWGRPNEGKQREEEIKTAPPEDSSVYALVCEQEEQPSSM